MGVEVIEPFKPARKPAGLREIGELAPASSRLINAGFQCEPECRSKPTWPHERTSKQRLKKVNRALAKHAFSPNSFFAVAWIRQEICWRSNGERSNIVPDCAECGDLTTDETMADSRIAVDEIGDFQTAASFCINIRATA
jgi:hypothetical protein